MTLQDIDDMEKGYEQLLFSPSHAYTKEDIIEILKSHIQENEGELSNTSYRWWRKYEKDDDLPTISTIREKFDNKRMKEILHQVQEEMNNGT